MKKLILIFILSFSLFFKPTNSYSMSPKAKAFLGLCAYGTVGGSLLGFASMAFGTNSRAIAQGASLGLYAGIIFGAYVVNSHKTPGAEIGGDGVGYGAEGGASGENWSEQGYPPADGSDGYGAPPAEENENGGGFFGAPNRVIDYSLESLDQLDQRNTKLRPQGPQFFMPIFIKNF